MAKKKKQQEKLDWGPGQEAHVQCVCGYTWWTHSYRAYVACPGCMRQRKKEKLKVLEVRDERGFSF